MMMTRIIITKEKEMTLVMNPSSCLNDEIDNQMVMTMMMMMMMMKKIIILIMPSKEIYSKDVGLYDDRSMKQFVPSSDLVLTRCDSVLQKINPIATKSSLFS